MSYLPGIFSIFLCVIVLLSVIWIIFPAPSYYIWLYSVAVSEWSLWFGLIALVGIVLGLANYAFYKNGVVLSIVIITGVIGFLISLYPFFTTLSVAREKNVSLSLSQYFDAVIGNKTKISSFQTYTFAKYGEMELKADVYLPDDKTIRSGASVIVIHGGSWSGGVRNDFPQWNSWLAENGFTVIDIDYTLAPQPNYLSAIGDVKSAIHWVKQHSAEFGIDRDKITLLGRSAGGHLALITAYSANTEDEKVCAVVSFYAPTDLVWAYDNKANPYVIDGPTTLSNFLGGNPHQSDELHERYLLTSPADRIEAKTPPTLLLHGGKDQLVREENMSILADKLNAAKIRNETLYIPYGQHGFDYNINGWGSQIAKPVILKFLIENTQTK